MGTVIRAHFGPRVSETTKKLYKQAAERVGTSTLAVRPDGPKGAPIPQDGGLYASLGLLAKVMVGAKAVKAGFKKTSRGWETPDGVRLTDEEIVDLVR
jgi:hypothetical protein